MMQIGMDYMTSNSCFSVVDGRDCAEHAHWASNERSESRSENGELRRLRRAMTGMDNSKSG